MIAFTCPYGRALTKSIMLLDCVTGEALKLEGHHFDFTNTKTVLVNKELYTFKEGNPVSAYKIAAFTSTDHLVTTLSKLPLDDKLTIFAVSYWAAAGSIVLTGGRGSHFNPTAQTFLLAVQTGRW